jgi:hypothetical protein
LPALAVYTAVGEAEQFDAHGIVVLRIEGGQSLISPGFGDGTLHERFGLLRLLTD